jgi:hydrogenase maturation protease
VTDVTPADHGSAFRLNGRAVVIGVGNSFRRDDGVGIAAARRLRPKAPPAIVIKECGGEATALIDAWQGADIAVVVDAVFADEPPGSVLRFDALACPPPRELFQFSSHTLGVVEAIELARAIDKLPPRLIVYGVVGREFSAGEGLTTRVEAAVDRVVARVSEDILRLSGKA